jgi:hypothetical protein
MGGYSKCQCNAIMVSDGFTPKEVGIIDPSATYSSGYVSFPFLSLKVLFSCIFTSYYALLATSSSRWVGSVGPHKGSALNLEGLVGFEPCW